MHSLPELSELCYDIKNDLLEIDEYKNGIISYAMGCCTVLWINDFILTKELILLGISNGYANGIMNIEDIINVDVLLNQCIDTIKYAVEIFNIQAEKILKTAIKNNNPLIFQINKIINLKMDNICENMHEQKYIHEQKYVHTICMYAARYGNISVLEHMYNLGYDIDNNIMLEAIYRNQNDVIKWGIKMLTIDEIYYLGSIAHMYSNATAQKILQSS